MLAALLDMLRCVLIAALPGVRGLKLVVVEAMGCLLWEPDGALASVRLDLVG